MRTFCGILFGLAGIGLLVQGAGGVLADEQGRKASPSAVEQQDPVPQPEELDQAITQWNDPQDQQRAGELFSAILRQQDPRAQKRLFKRFSERAAQLNPPAAESTEGQAQESARAQELTLEQQEAMEILRLSFEIEALRLGLDATVEDLLERDDVLGRIVAIRDPDSRDQLLKRLEERERQALEEQEQAAQTQPPQEPLPEDIPSSELPTESPVSP